MSYIVAENLMRQYADGDAAVVAVQDMSFEIDAGEFVAIMGESGAGKSTLLSIMGAMNPPSSGEYLVDEIPVYRLKPEQRADFRREFLGFVFQSHHLVPYLTLGENVMLPLVTLKMSKRKKHKMAEEALERVGLTGKANRLPSQVSGGEQERVAIARAIVNEPPVLMADEPTGNLDSKTTQEIMNLVQELNKEGMTVVMVTHSSQCAGFAQRILSVSDGRLIQDDRSRRNMLSEVRQAV